MEYNVKSKIWRGIGRYICMYRQFKGQALTTSWLTGGGQGCVSRGNAEAQEGVLDGE
jgi:hypothetical protein